MLRRRRTSRAGAGDDDPHGEEEDLQLIGQELVAVEAQPDALEGMA